MNKLLQRKREKKREKKQRAREKSQQHPIPSSDAERSRTFG
jgi:hypothetical protein